MHAQSEKLYKIVQQAKKCKVTSAMALREMLVRITPRKRVCGCSALFITREEFDEFICCVVPPWYGLMSLIHEWGFPAAQPKRALAAAEALLENRRDNFVSSASRGNC